MVRFFLLVFSCLLVSTLPAQAETTLENIQKTGILKVGIRDDAIPFGYRDYQDHFSGVCIDFVDLLKKRILTKLNRKIISVALVESNLFNRFRLVEDNVVHLECGPNSIKEDLEFNVIFSNPFFVTGTQFFLKKNQLENINLNGNLSNVSLGVLRNTNTEAYLRANYPQANIILFQGETGRARGVQAVGGERIAAMVSDGILLLGEAIAQGLPVEDNYTLLPEKPITCEYYGMILPKDDPQWEELVNSAIAEFETTETTWFIEIEDYVKTIENYCENRGRELP
ncbi:amino acid ABC transporter substrate-binding protein [Gloeocapsa sp. PCC 73106]|uniref:amino acid ABC transporter substrate-binding protein n=1 Tax=Gloeocapsa sp. PCC 73106 TaxID=102232 RepID=UPI0002ACE25D|nr:amino acid ABC transporter substrate-binding protein [Gloeocapsa sp. PCC 73106]ELR98127.1 periplasmic component of amino acid ABC-type transporter/signal transduction system [Gloeocapsa sp. PCC 73106]